MNEFTDEALNLALSEYFDISPRSDWSEAQRVGMRKAILTALRDGGLAQARADRRALTMIAAECHRAKWQFDIDDEEPPKAAAVRVLVDLAFKTLHRIGDMALNLRDGSVVPSTKCGCLACDMDGPHASSCAVHNGTALDVGPCDCGASSASTLSRPKLCTGSSDVGGSND